MIKSTLEILAGASISIRAISFYHKRQFMRKNLMKTVGKPA